MTQPTCECIKQAYHRKFTRNQSFGTPNDDFPIRFNHKSRFIVSAGYNRGTVMLPTNYCPNCGKPSREVK